MKASNDAFRFLLELAGIAALALWGWEVGSPGPLRFVFAVVAPLALIVIWALLVAPKANSPLDPSVRVIVGSGLLLLAAGVLWLAGQPAAALLFAVLIVANTVAWAVLPK